VRTRRGIAREPTVMGTIRPNEVRRWIATAHQPDRVFDDSPKREGRGFFFSQTRKSKHACTTD